ncbi:hypothetical protein NDU88_001881 [Pleurodeles waltl]|uniref:Uncharacterized protein n=1 Tax=Pleurodeles waltl TaxID=8319 RepID=A0AAV7T0V2_PLEWA|nr:hypothetical protein NDU88_001881 [Pleurodeles waltl]
MGEGTGSHCQESAVAAPGFMSGGRARQFISESTRWVEGRAHPHSPLKGTQPAFLARRDRSCQSKGRPHPTPTEDAKAGRIAGVLLTDHVWQCVRSGVPAACTPGLPALNLPAVCGPGSSV